MSRHATARRRARRVAHLVVRFFASLRARPLDDATVAWVAGTLDAGELRVWEGMGRSDRAEGVAVARALDAALADAPEAADSRWRAAALLHDAGKQVSGYRTVARAVVTIVATVVGDAKARTWATGPRGSSRSVRARMGRYVVHDELGAELLRQAGARPEVAAWAGAHHRPERWGATGIPEAVCRTLAVADGEV